MSSEEISRIRRKKDYELMQKMRGPVIDFTVNDENDPTEYIITFNIRTCMGEDEQGEPEYREKSTVKVTLPPDYPLSAPRSVMLEDAPAHVHWYRNGLWDYGRWDACEPLWSHIRAMARTLQFRPEYTNINSVASYQHKDLWKRGLEKGWFPCDTQALPTPAPKRKIHILYEKETGKTD